MRTLNFCPVVSFFFFFPLFFRLISAVADWMSTILLHMVSRTLTQIVPQICKTIPLRIQQLNMPFQSSEIFFCWISYPSPSGPHYWPPTKPSESSKIYTSASLLLLLLPFYSHYTGQLEDFADAKFHCTHALILKSLNIWQSWGKKADCLKHSVPWALSCWKLKNLP